MSFFPSPDLQKLRAASSYNPVFYSTPLTPPCSHPNSSNPAAPMITAGPETFAAPRYLPSWQSNEPRGLGLLPASSEAGSASIPISSPDFQWATQFTTSNYATKLSDAMRKDSWRDDSEQLSDLLPSVSLWEQPCIPAPDNLPRSSSGRSEYSGSTHHSCVSTPYTHTDRLFKTADVVKIEDSIELDHGPLGFVREAVHFDQSALVNPNDLVAYPPAATPCTAPSSLFSRRTSSHVGSPAASSPRDHFRRVVSADDVQLEALESRRKRGFTNVETASCSCATCGKLFQRTYNLKAHMETHDPDRSQPHACPYGGCCKRFVRKTDLMRHKQSVSQKDGFAM